MQLGQDIVIAGIVIGVTTLRVLLVVAVAGMVYFGVRFAMRRQKRSAGVH